MVMIKANMPDTNDNGMSNLIKVKRHKLYINTWII